MATGEIPRNHLISKTYTVTLEENSSIPSPYHYYGSLILADDIAQYGEVVSYIASGKSTQPIATKTNNAITQIWIYAINLPSDGTTVNVKVFFR